MRRKIYKPDELIAACAIQESKGKTRSQVAKDVKVAELTLRTILAGQGTNLVTLKKVAQNLGCKLTVRIERRKANGASA